MPSAKLEGTTIEVAGGLNAHRCLLLIQVETLSKSPGIAAKIGLDLKASGTGGLQMLICRPAGIPVLDGWERLVTGSIPNGNLFADSLPERSRLLAAILREW